MPILTCEDEVLIILDKLNSENACIDYKQMPYLDEKKYELLKDIVAFLNCEQSFGYDKYIIIGVMEENHQYTRVGLKPTMPVMFDDSELQTLLNNIRPRPIVNAGTVTYGTEKYGYIHISSANKDVTYEISKNYPDTTHKIHEGQAFIRIGTTKKVMTREDRARLERLVDNRYAYISPLIKENNLKQQKTSLSFNLIAALIGAWHSNYAGDRAVIEILSDSQYEDWEIESQRRIAEGDERITYNQGLWAFQEHIELLMLNSHAYFDSHLSTFFSILIDVLTAYDNKFDMPSDQRMIITSNTPSGKYSKDLREALILSFVNIATRHKRFISCTKSFIRNNTYKAITSLITEGSWKVFATLNWQFVIIAQADPNAFCTALQKVLKKQNNGIARYLLEKEEGIFATGYYHGLVSALQTLTWNEKLFSTASTILFSLSRINKEIKGSFISIFLPWHPQTEAPLKTRIGVIKHLVAEYGVECWDVVYKLMPRQTPFGTEIQPPKYIDGSFEQKTVFTDEYWSVSEQYLDELLSIATVNREHCGDLVDLLDDVNRKMFDKIIGFLKSFSDDFDSDANRYPLWDKLISFIERHRYFSDADWALPEELLQVIDELISALSPHSLDIVETRLFKKEQYDLLKLNKDRRLAESELRRQQETSIKRIYNEHDISGILQFVESVGSPQVVGLILATLPISTNDEETILEQLLSNDEKQKLLAKNYCNSKYRLNGEIWLTSINIRNMAKEKRLLVLSSFFICAAILNIVFTLSPEEQGEYWSLASPWSEDDGITQQTVVGLINANRLEYALEILVRMIENGSLDSPELAYFVLEANKSITNEKSQMWSYYVVQVFEWLHRDIVSNNIEKLTLFEWYYYPVLSQEGHANALDYTLSSSPETFLSILSFVYKSDRELEPSTQLVQERGENVPHEAIDLENRKRLASHAWNILYNWKWVPGVQLDGSFDAKAYIDWIDSVKVLSAQKGLYEIALQTIGHVLYYASTSDDGFFIQHKVAETLEKEENEHMRIGYSTEAYNARGVYNYDPSGAQEDELAKSWVDNALIAESHGYTCFGKTLRDIAQGFLDQKEHY